jgi:hypothetical protein
VKFSTKKVIVSHIFLYFLEKITEELVMSASEDAFKKYKHSHENKVKQIAMEQKSLVEHEMKHIYSDIEQNVANAVNRKTQELQMRRSQSFSANSGANPEIKDDNNFYNDGYSSEEPRRRDSRQSFSEFKNWKTKNRKNEPQSMMTERFTQEEFDGSRSQMIPPSQSSRREPIPMQPPKQQFQQVEQPRLEPSRINQQFGQLLVQQQAPKQVQQPIQQQPQPVTYKPQVAQMVSDSVESYGSGVALNKPEPIQLTKRSQPKPQPNILQVSPDETSLHSPLPHAISGETPMIFLSSGFPSSGIDRYATSEAATPKPIEETQAEDLYQEEETEEPFSVKEEPTMISKPSGTTNGNLTSVSIKKDIPQIMITANTPSTPMIMTPTPETPKYATSKPEVKIEEKKPEEVIKVPPKKKIKPEPEQQKEEPKIEPKVEPEVEPKPELKVEPKAEPKVEPKTEPKKPQEEPKPEPKKPKDEPKPEPKSTQDEPKQTQPEPQNTKEEPKDTKKKSLGGILSGMFKKKPQEKPVEVEASSDAQSDNEFLVHKAQDRKQNDRVKQVVSKKMPNMLVTSFHGLSKSVETNITKQQNEIMKTSMAYKLQQGSDTSGTEFPYTSIEKQVTADARLGVIQEFMEEKKYSSADIQTQCVALLDLLKYFPQPLISANLINEVLKDANERSIDPADIRDEYFTGTSQHMWDALIEHIAAISAIDTKRRETILNVFGETLYPSAAEIERSKLVPKIKMLLKVSITQKPQKTEKKAEKKAEKKEEKKAEPQKEAPKKATIKEPPKKSTLDSSESEEDEPPPKRLQASEPQFKLPSSTPKKKHSSLIMGGGGEGINIRPTNVFASGSSRGGSSILSKIQASKNDQFNFDEFDSGASKRRKKDDDEFDD